MQEVLNMTSRYFNINILEKIPNMVELQEKAHRKMMLFLRGDEADSSFNVKPIRLMKDLISQHTALPATVLVDDTTNIPGLIECLTHDHGITVILTSDKEKGIFRYRPDEPMEVMSTVH